MKKPSKLTTPIEGSPSLSMSQSYRSVFSFAYFAKHSLRPSIPGILPGAFVTFPIALLFEFVIEIGPSVTGNYSARFETKDEVNNVPAAKAIADLLAAPSKAIFDWNLYNEPADRSYTLNFVYVGPAAGSEQGADSN